MRATQARNGCIMHRGCQVWSRAEGMFVDAARSAALPAVVVLVIPKCARRTSRSHVLQCSSIHFTNSQFPYIFIYYSPTCSFQLIKNRFAFGRAVLDKIRLGTPTVTLSRCITDRVVMTSRAEGAFMRVHNRILI